MGRAMAPDPKPAIFRNLLLQAMPADDLAGLQPMLQHVELRIRHEMEAPRKPITHVYFMESGIASVVARSKSGEKVEVGIIGREGMTGLAVAMGNHQTSEECYVQVAGEGQR